jgi:hypothetical protein
MRCTIDWLTPNSLANLRQDQCVLPSSGVQALFDLAVALGFGQREDEPRSEHIAGGQGPRLCPKFQILFLFCSQFEQVSIAAMSYSGRNALSVSPGRDTRGVSCVYMRLSSGRLGCFPKHFLLRLHPILDLMPFRSSALLKQFVSSNANLFQKFGSRSRLSN